MASVRNFAKISTLSLINLYLLRYNELVTVPLKIILNLANSTVMITGTAVSIKSYDHLQ